MVSLPGKFLATNEDISDDQDIIQEDSASQGVVSSVLGLPSLFSVYTCHSFEYYIVPIFSKKTDLAHFFPFFELLMKSIMEPYCFPMFLMYIDSICTPTCILTYYPAQMLSI